MTELKSKFIFLLLAALATGQFIMQTTQANASTDPREDEQAIISIEHKLDQAYLSGDADYIDSILSPDFILTNVRGEVSKKAQEVAEVRNGIIHYDKFETSDLDVRLYGDAAVAMGRTSIKGTVKKSGRIIDGDIRITDTFVRRKNGTWQMVAGQTTLIPNEASISSQRPSSEKTETGERDVAAADGRGDFDFLIGNWRVHHRRLKERLANDHQWIEFEGTSTARKILGGFGNMDDNVLELPGDPYRAVTLRAYDPAKKQWLIWWLDSRMPGRLDPPVVGGFENGVGTFYADDTFKGKPIRVRFLWTQSNTPHWEQAFSEDGGKTWETNWTMDFVRNSTSSRTCCPIVELRQYTLVPGARETLIALFEREFIETQEATGMTVIGQFRDLNNPDRFVWLRGFSDMDARAAQLQDFYGGPVWKAHRDAANATMIDSDNVLLLRPARSDSGFSLANAGRPPLGSTETSRGVLIATICHLAGAPGSDFADFFETNLQPAIEQTGATIVASFVSENHPNTFPRLPVREDANVFVWFSLFPNRTAWEQHAAAFADSIREKQITGKLSRLTKGQPEVQLLAPTARSLVVRY